MLPQLREVLEKFLDDDSDMKDLNLTAKVPAPAPPRPAALPPAGGRCPPIELPCQPL